MVAMMDELSTWALVADATSWISASVRAGETGPIGEAERSRGNRGGGEEPTRRGDSTADESGADGDERERTPDSVTRCLDTEVKNRSRRARRVRARARI